ncbi:hypothetical protein THAOC_11342 [Thalassiosira oceanica]|uniref:Uncharacterized protein n=1 Tax=Thalassiosira oceanica TaxID=159749 RepID=K0SMT2_THAOC|nr:hypothetical protein THAOC_11342 [Thalassiosira oceanica]|eukprot:EJK67603.1 hypothetical protein THAOC_11342 [Thalassiosira oceanica]
MSQGDDEDEAEKMRLAFQQFMLTGKKAADDGARPAEGGPSASTPAASSSSKKKKKNKKGKRRHTSSPVLAAPPAESSPAARADPVGSRQAGQDGQETVLQPAALLQRQGEDVDGHGRPHPGGPRQHRQDTPAPPGRVEAEGVPPVVERARRPLEAPRARRGGVARVGPSATGGRGPRALARPRSAREDARRPPRAHVRPRRPGRGRGTGPRRPSEVPPRVRSRRRRGGRRRGRGDSPVGRRDVPHGLPRAVPEAGASRPDSVRLDDGRDARPGRRGEGRGEGGGGAEAARGCCRAWRRDSDESCFDRRVFDHATGLDTRMTSLQA